MKTQQKVTAAFFLALWPIWGWSHNAEEANLVVKWNGAALQGVRDSKLGPPMVARALAIVHTCMYDAWAAYDEHAVGTQTGTRLRQSERQRSEANQEKAISFAAYRAAVDLFPVDRVNVFDALMAELGYDPNDTSMNTNTPSGVGNAACAAILASRHHDGSNQLGDLTPSGVPYADYTNFTPLNGPSIVPVNPATVNDVNYWQPLQYFDATGKFITQICVGPHWGKVAAFALTSPDQFQSTLETFGPATYGSSAFVDQARELVDISAQLTDSQKMIAEYWADGPHSELPPGHWNLFGQFVSLRDRHRLASDVKMFFALTNAMLDASIVAWGAKRVFDSVRPVTAIPFLFHGQQVRAWGGPNAGTVVMDAANWIPYQPTTFPTPPFPEFISGHSTFSAAGAEILRLFTGSDKFGDTVTFLPGSSRVEPGFTPASKVTLTWPTFSVAADQAGFSRRLGGIHFEPGDLAGRKAGRLIARQVFAKAQSLWRGAEQDDSDK